MAADDLSAEDLSQFRFPGGEMKGFRVSSGTTRYLRYLVETLPPGTTTARACRWELAEREAGRGYGKRAEEAGSER